MKKRPVLLSALFALPVIAGATLALGGNQLALQDAAKPNAGAVAASERQTQSIPTTDRSTALIEAAERGDAVAVDRLLKSGADKNAANSLEATPLYAAAGNADPAATERLLAAGADPNAHLLSGETPLMAAAYRGNIRVVQALLKAHADPNVQESNGGQTALMWAILEQHPDVSAALIQAGAKVNLRSKQGMTALMFAAQEDDARSAELLIKAGADPNAVMAEKGWTPLILASAQANSDVVHVLLADKADPNAVDGEGFTALIYAAQKKSAAAVVKDLLDHGANPNARVTKDSLQLHTDVDIDFYGATAMAVAALHNHYDVIKTLIDHGADPKIATQLGATPLMMASGCARASFQEGSAEERATAIKTAKLLVAHGADVNQVGQFKLTAVHCAALQRLNDLVRFLASKGANLDLKDDLGETPLSNAYGVLTKVAQAPGVNHRRIPEIAHKDTIALLLELGATPLDKSGVEVAKIAGAGS